MHKLFGRTDPSEGKKCGECKKFKKWEEFYPIRSKEGKYAYRCIQCTKDLMKTKYKRTSERSRAIHLKRTYDLTEEEYGVLYQEQNGVCAICGQPETNVNSKTGKVRNLAIDHSHKTGRIRGLLCRKCNTALGNLDEDIDKIQRLIDYIKDYED